MLRKIIRIDSELCNGCGLCVQACHEGAIGLKDGKAVLLRDDYCDGLGDCLPSCPVNAISFEEREAAAFDAEAVQVHMAARAQAQPQQGGCPGSRAAAINREGQGGHHQGHQGHHHGHQGGCPGSRAAALNRREAPAATAAPSAAPQSELMQWPVQIKLVPVNAPYFDGARLLIAADCTAFAYGDFHQRFIKNHVAVIGCPKLDEGDYSEKLTQILARNNIKSVTVVRMEVPCCGGISNAAVRALQNCGKMIPWNVVTISVDGQILDEEAV